MICLHLSPLSEMQVPAVKGSWWNIVFGWEGKGSGDGKVEGVVAGRKGVQVSGHADRTETLVVSAWRV